MVIRDMRKTDVDFIYKKCKEIEEFKAQKEIPGGWNMKTLYRWIKSKKDPSFVLEQDEKIIGFVLARFCEITNTLDFENMWVREAYRRKRIAKILINELIRRTKTDSFENFS